MFGVYVFILVLLQEFVRGAVVIMAEQAKRDRDTAVIEMYDAIRQVERYLSSHNPSIRILKQKITKVDDKKEGVKHCHFEYCRKAKVPVDDDDAKQFYTIILEKVIMLLLKSTFDF